MNRPEGPIPSILSSLASSWTPQAAKSTYVLNDGLPKPAVGGTVGEEGLPLWGGEDGGGAVVGVGGRQDGGEAGGGSPVETVV